MKDAGLLSGDELQKELDAFYDFTRVTGMGYLNDEGLVRFNELRGEWTIRSDTSRIDAAFAQLEQVEASYRKHFGPIPPIAERLRR